MINGQPQMLRTALALLLALSLVFSCSVSHRRARQGRYFLRFLRSAGGSGGGSSHQSQLSPQMVA
jgi:hypothetical protein